MDLWLDQGKGRTCRTLLQFYCILSYQECRCTFRDTQQTLCSEALSFWSGSQVSFEAQTALVSLDDCLQSRLVERTGSHSRRLTRKQTDISPRKWQPLRTYLEVWDSLQWKRVIHGGRNYVKGNPQELGYPWSVVHDGTLSIESDTLCSWQMWRFSAHSCHLQKLAPWSVVLRQLLATWDLECSKLVSWKMQLQISIVSAASSLGEECVSFVS